MKMKSFGAWLWICLFSWEVSGLEWSWSGGLEPTSLVLKAKVGLVDKEQVAVAVTGGESERTYKAQSVSAFGIATFSLDGLVPNTQYTYKVSVRDTKMPLVGRFRTPLGERQNFSFGFASCADNHSDAIIFDVIRQHDPLFFLHMGDLHYGNVEVNDQAVFQSMYDQVMSNKRQRDLWANVPIVYMWDDHDYGPNNSDESSPGRESSIKAFLETVPSYPLAAYAGGQQTNKDKLASVYFAFSIGRVRFIVTDTSSSKVADTSALGKEQLAWFKKELAEAAASSDLVIWVSTMPWNSIHSKWGEFKLEREDIVSFIEQHAPLAEKMVMLSGDAHMLALDDGTHVPGGFPVFQAAALDAKPTCKGGPYSHGIYPGRNQYGWLDIVYPTDSDTPCYVFSGRRVDAHSGEEQELLHFDSCDASKNSPRNTYYPSPEWVETLWKQFKKKIVPLLENGDDIMVFFDSFRFSAGMVFVEVAKVTVISAIILGAFLYLAK